MNFQKERFNRNLLKVDSSDRLKKWLDICENLEYWLQSSSLISLKFRRRIRKGIPKLIRPYLWAEFLKINQNVTCYSFSFKNLKNGEPSKYRSQIEKDILRSLPESKVFISDKRNYSDLFDVLIAYSKINPEIGYCQGIAPVAAFILLIFTPEKAFYGLVYLIENYMKDYFTPGFDGFMKDCQALEVLIKKYIPHFWDIMMKYNIGACMFCLDWLTCLFVRSFPVEICQIIWDQILYEGRNVLLRVSLAIIKACFPRKISNFDELNGFIVCQKLQFFKNDESIDITSILPMSYKYLT